MNNALVSGGIGVASGSVSALIQWAFTSAGHPVPAEVLPILTGALVYVGHVAKGYLATKFAPAAPAAVTQ
ncbi:hypothetical protein [Paraburkholderia fungorum]|uniref:hypothetical protein n=1 Tax=Paraburkholderia fungorum TaxID=134537 RepID=UPI001609DECC|nr:hypothetical protein [Paraburkholderia fungorum]MBB5547555.1 hypothetical protein [Paraburkholderia fungorum]